MPPAEILTTGSFVTGTCIKPNITVDLVVVIPQVNVLYNYFYSHLCVHMEDLNFFITFRLEAGAKNIGMSCCVCFRF